MGKIFFKNYDSALSVVRAARFRIENRLAGLPKPARPIEEYARATISWLLTAQAATPDDGVADGYNVLSKKWGASYPETTGYIITSLLRAERSGIGDRTQLRSAVVAMGSWLLTTQLECGAFPGGNMDVAKRNPKPTVFNTGQILKGLTDLISEGLDSDGRVASGARRAADWLLQIQDPDGAWYQGRSPWTEGPVHAYDIRTAWALARYGKQFDDSNAFKAAVRNAEWLMSKRDEEGWFAHLAFRPEDDPLTHTVAYTIQGLQEIAVLCRRSEFLSAAVNAARKMRTLQDPKTGAVPGQISAGYHRGATWTNTTGNAQMAIIWLRLADITKDSSWREPGLMANAFNCSIQELDMESRDPGRRGGLRGSNPAHKGYGSFWYMNWTQKFHLDALLAQKGVKIV
jgi:hypothetical protein